jgi:hypothetical protein
MLTSTIDGHYTCPLNWFWPRCSGNDTAAATLILVIPPAIARRVFKALAFVDGSPPAFAFAALAYFVLLWWWRCPRVEDGLLWMLRPLLHLVVVVLVERPGVVVSTPFAFAAATPSTFSVLTFALTFTWLLLLEDLLRCAAVLDVVVGLRRSVALANAERALFLG